MRVRLSYTVEAEDVLTETANLLGLSAPALQEVITLFGTLQQELKKETEDPPGVVNINLCLETVGQLREHLINLDIKLSEIIEIINGFENIKRSPEALTTAEEEEA